MHFEFRDIVRIAARAHGTAVHLDEMFHERHAGREGPLRLPVADLAR